MAGGDGRHGTDGDPRRSNELDWWGRSGGGGSASPDPQSGPADPYGAYAAQGPSVAPPPGPPLPGYQGQQGYQGYQGTQPLGAQAPGQWPPPHGGGMRPRRRRGPLVAGVTVLVVALAVVGWVTVRGAGDVTAKPTPVATGAAPAPASPTPTTSPTPRPRPTTTDPLGPGVVWAVAPASLVPETQVDYAFDMQTAGERVIATPEAWIVPLSRDLGMLQGVAALDPGSGDPLWSLAFDAGLCADDVRDGVLACLAGPADAFGREGGISPSPLVMHLVDVATGDTTQVQLDLYSLRSLHLTDAGLIVLGYTEPEAPHAMLTLVGLDGQVRWQHDLGTLRDADGLFLDVLSSNENGSLDPQRTMERIRWRDLDDGRVLLWSQPSAVLIDVATGPVGDAAQYCARATPAGDGYYCMTYDVSTSVPEATTVHRFDLNGDPVWSAPGIQLISAGTENRAQPVAVRGRTLVAVDWATGDVGGDLGTFAEAAPNEITGIVPMLRIEASQGETFVIAQDGVTRIARDGSVAWRHELGDRDYFRSLVVTSDATGRAVVVLDVSAGRVLDLETGDLLLEADLPVGDLDWAPEGLVSIGVDEVRRYDLP